MLTGVVLLLRPLEMVTPPESSPWAATLHQYLQDLALPEKCDKNKGKRVVIKNENPCQLILSRNGNFTRGDDC